MGNTQPVYYGSEELYIDKTVKLSYFARRLSDVVPNPWQAARISQELMQKLRDTGESEEQTFDRAVVSRFCAT